MQLIFHQVVAAVVKRATHGSLYRNHIIPIGRRQRLQQQTRTAIMKKMRRKLRSECGRRAICAAFTTNMVSHTI